MDKKERIFSLSVRSASFFKSFYGLNPKYKEKFVKNISKKLLFWWVESRVCLPAACAIVKLTAFELSGLPLGQIARATSYHHNVNYCSRLAPISS
jgi:hypothetical protein